MVLLSDFKRNESTVFLQKIVIEKFEDTDFESINELWILNCEIKCNLFKEITKLLNLQILRINCSCVNFTLKKIPDSIEKLKKLVILQLNFLGIQKISPMIGKCTELTSLALNNNNIIQLPNEIENCTNLRILDLKNN